MRLCASLSRGVAAPLGCVICLQLGDVAVFFTLCAVLSERARWGWYHYPRSVSHGSETLRGRVSERQTLPLLGLGRVLPKNAESLRNSDALMRVAVPRRCGPAGLRDLFSFLLKLRLVRPVPDTSFGSPDAPACAVPVQALSRLALFQLGVVQGFSLFPFCLTLFDLLFESGDKKRPSTFRTLRPVNGQFFGIQFFKLAGGKRFVKTVCGRQVHRG